MKIINPLEPHHEEFNLVKKMGRGRHKLTHSIMEINTKETSSEVERSVTEDASTSDGNTYESQINDAGLQQDRFDVPGLEATSKFYKGSTSLSYSSGHDSWADHMETRIYQYIRN